MPQGKILVVDDEPEIVSTVSRRLRAMGYTVYTAADGNEAFETACRELPQVIILDISMPLADGHETAAKLFEHESTARVPIVFLTARTAGEDYMKAFDQGVFKYITKPFEPEELILAVEQLLRRADAVRSS